MIEVGVGDGSADGTGSLTARDVALRLLNELFGGQPRRAAGPRADGIPPTIALTEFQAEGVARVREILRRRGGAVLADSVGLGKTFVALALIEESVRAGGEAVVVVPASLRGLWRRGLHRLPGGGGRWVLLSHAQLARGAVVTPPGEGAALEGFPAGRLLVVDEAHRFRNPSTLRYAALARLTAPAAAVLLMTATPVNNAPRDLLHLLRLFSPDDGFRELGVPSLHDAFATAGRDAPPGGADPARAGAVIHDVVVRRTRAMLRDRFDTPGDPALIDGARFPSRAQAQVTRYPDPDLRRLVEGVAELELRVYAPLRPVPEAQARAAVEAQPARAAGGSLDGAVALLRLNLLKRLDSSPAAFQASLARLELLLRTALDAARSGRVLTPGAALGGGNAGRGDTDPLQLTLVELVADAASPNVDLIDLEGSFERDLARVRRLARLRTAGEHAGAKQRALLDLLEGTRGEKTLVFTEYRDTARSLWRTLRDRFPTARVDGSGAWLGRRPAGRRVVVERFAPAANMRPPPPDRERVDVLIATDVLAEGLNLQDARHVVSYDLPWNPVRLLQRVGRVDRLGSPHREVVPYLFAPAQGVEAMLGLTRRIRTKLGHIAATVGAEHADDLLQRLSETAQGGSLADIECAPAKEEPVEGLRTLWIRTRKRHTIRSGSPSGLRSGQSARPGPTQGFISAPVLLPPEHEAAGLAWLVLVDHTGLRRLLEIDEDGRVAEAGSAALACLSFALSADPTPGDALPTAPERVPVRALTHHLRETALSGEAPARLRPHDPARRLAHRIRLTVSQEGAALDPLLIARVDALLARLGAPLPLAAEDRARALIRSLTDDTGLVALLDAAEAAVHGRIPEAGCGCGHPVGPENITIVAALRIRPRRRLAAVDACRDRS